MSPILNGVRMGEDDDRMLPFFGCPVDVYAVAIGIDVFGEVNKTASEGQRTPFPFNAVQDLIK